MILELRDNNLYATGRIIEFSDGEALLTREPLKVIGNELDKYHTVTAFDRIDVLAWKYYKNFISDASKYWWVIADANYIINPLDLSDFIGKEILIPDLARIRLEL